ncbi:hypothetical protein JQ632_25275 [Bradyrhizobium liaoningense]|nr:hypothetical protein [Bradyrhizobium liaoningense]
MRHEAFGTLWIEASLQPVELNRDGEAHVEGPEERLRRLDRRDRLGEGLRRSGCCLNVVVETLERRIRIAAQRQMRRKIRCAEARRKLADERSEKCRVFGARH